MKIWLATIPFSSTYLTDELFERGLLCVDEESRGRIRKFYHRQDAWRCLIGRLLPRILLKELGVISESVSFATTPSGKPCIAMPTLDPFISFNISHDGSLVAMAWDEGDRNEIENVGMDVMKVSLPRGESVQSFIRALAEQLSPLERQLLSSPGQSDDLLLQRVFWIWTVKETYTKALGLGMGFDFGRIEFNYLTDEVKVDGGTELYEGVAARCVGGLLECSVVRTSLEEVSRSKVFKLISAVDVVNESCIYGMPKRPA